MTGPAGGATSVSVVIAARNAEATLPATLDSLSRQTHVPAEVIVVDDGSVDGTAAAARVGGARLIQSPPVGLPAARNLALAEVVGDVVAIVDADDVFTPDHVAAGLHRLESAGADAVAVDAWYWVDGRVTPFTHFACSRPPAVVTEDALLRGNPLLSTCFVRTSVLRALSGYDAALPALEDYDLWLRMAEAGHRIVPATRATMFYRRDGGMTADAAQMYAALRAVLAAHGRRSGGAALTPVAAHAAVGAGNWALLSGDPVAARAHWCEARRLGDDRASLRMLMTASRLSARLTTLALRRRLVAAGRPLPVEVVTWWRRGGGRAPRVLRPDLGSAP